MAQNTVLDSNSLTYLACNAHAFIIASQKIAGEIHNAAVGSTAHTALLSALNSNLGLGIELKLKHIHHITEGYIPHVHTYIDLYESMSSQVGLDVKKQLDIEWRNRKDNENLSAIGTILQWFPNENTAKSQPPFRGQYKGFKFILEYLDHLNLYGYRYSFEKDYKSRVMMDFSPVFLRILIDVLTDISNKLIHSNN